MSSKRKTLKQKIASDYRRQIFLENKSISTSFNPNVIKVMEQKILSTPTIAIKHPYLIHDISKTGILSLAIIAMQIILFFLLKNNMLTLPMIKY